MVKKVCLIIVYILKISRIVGYFRVKVSVIIKYDWVIIWIN